MFPFFFVSFFVHIMIFLDTQSKFCFLFFHLFLFSVPNGYLGRFSIESYELFFPCSESSGEDRSKRPRKVEDEKRKSRKSDKKEKSKDKKNSHKHSKRHSDRGIMQTFRFWTFSFFYISNLAKNDTIPRT